MTETTTPTSFRNTAPGPLMHHDRNPYGIVGTALADVTDAADALRLGGLDYLVERHPVQTVVHVDAQPARFDLTGYYDEVPAINQVVDVPGQFASVRRHADGRIVPLGITGSQFRPIQNTWTTDLMQALVDDSHGTWQAVGYTHNGARTFAQLALPETVLIGGRDPIGFSLVVRNHHDGSGKLRGNPFGSRLFCTNQFPSMNRMTTQFSIGHTSGAIAKFDIEEARKALTLTLNYAREVETVGNKLINAKLSGSELVAFLDALYPPAKDKDTGEELETTTARRNQIASIFVDEEDQAEIGGTRWGALQAVIAYEDWNKPTRGGSTSHARETRIVTGASDDIKWNAAELLLAGV